MRTTHVNLQTTAKRNRRDEIISFFDKPIVKGIILLLLILFLTIISKAQNPDATKGNDLTLVAMNNNKIIKDTMEQKSDVSFASQATQNSDKLSINGLDPNVVKANAIVTSYFRGEQDADIHYKSKKSGMGTILTSTLIGGPVLGLIPTAICSSITPSKKHLEVPKTKLLSDEPYMIGYKSEARYIKKHNTWPCFVAASVVWVCLAGFLVIH